MKFQAIIYALAGLVATTLAVNISDIQQDLQAMITQANIFQTGIAKFPSTGSAILASGLHNNTANLGGAIGQGDGDLAGFVGIIPENDAEGILKSWTVFANSVEPALKQIVEKKNSIISSGSTVQSVVLNDLKDLQASVAAYQPCLHITMPSDYRDHFGPIEDPLISAFRLAIAAYYP